MAAPSKTQAVNSTESVRFSHLGSRSQHIAETLRLNRDEAGYLDKKLPAELVAMVAQAIDALKSPSTRVDAERFLGAEILDEASPADVLIAILRQSFRVGDDSQSKWLANHLSRLVELDETGIGRQALLEAAGSEIPALSRLVDEVSLQVATDDDLARLALDFYCSPTVRISAAGKLLQRADLQGIEAALDLIWHFHDNPDLVDSLRSLIKYVKALERMDYDQLVEHIIEPTLYTFNKTSREQPERQKLLALLVEQLPAAFLRYFQAMTAASLDDNWFNVVYALGRCAFHEVGATELLLDWASDESTPDHIRAECCIRLAHDNTQRPRDFGERLARLQDSISYTIHSRRMQEKAEEALQRVTNGRVKRSADAAYRELFEDWKASGIVDRELGWNLWMAQGARQLLIQKIRKGDGPALKFLADFLISPVVDKARPDQRCELLLEYAQRASLERENIYEALWRSASRLGSKGGLRQKAIDFFVARTNAGSHDMEIARQYWQRLSRPR